MLKLEGETWRLKSSEIQLTQGDNNTEFVHKYANYRRNLNTIWDLKDENGNVVSSQHDSEKKAE